MKYLFMTLLLSCGCSKYPQTNIGMVHDYIFAKAERLCAQHAGLHYIVSIRTVMKKHSNEPIDFNDYPCEDNYKVRCQDQTLQYINSSVSYCFIDQSQMDETLEGK